MPRLRSRSALRNRQSCSKRKRQLFEHARIAPNQLTSHLRIGACQTPEILGDVEAALACMETFARRPASDEVDLLLFPECFLQGYLVESEHISKYALDLTATSFQKILDRLSPIRPTLVFGVIEHAVRPTSTRRSW